jgi:hypothetical protein
VNTVDDRSASLACEGFPNGRVSLIQNAYKHAYIQAEEQEHDAILRLGQHEIADLSKDNPSTWLCSPNYPQRPPRIGKEQPANDVRPSQANGGCPDSMKNSPGEFAIALHT